MNETAEVIEVPQEAQTPEVKKITEQALSLVKRFDQYPVETEEQFEAGAEDLRIIKDAIDEVEAQRTAITQPMNAALRSVNAFFKRFSDPLAEAQRTIKRGLGQYSAEQKRLADEAARKEREKAKRREEKLRRQAEEAEAEGREERAQTLGNRADQVAAAPTQPAAPKREGAAAKVHTRDNWKFEITDASKIPDQYKKIDEQKIGKVVKALKADTDIPGIRVYNDPIVTSRR